MGAVDVERQGLNVFRMELLGAEVRAVHSGSKTLKDAINEALRDWVATVADDALLHRIGHGSRIRIRTSSASCSASWATRRAVQCRDCLGGFDPDVVVACVGGGSNAAGTFAGFVDTGARLVGVEAAGGAAMSNGVLGVGARHALPVPAGRGRARSSRRSSISAGLDYPGVGPEHAYLGAIGQGRVRPRRGRRGARRLPAAGRDRGHHPRPRARPRARLGREGGGQVDPGRVRGADHALGPGRQGRGAGQGALRGDDPAALGDRLSGPVATPGPSCSSRT